jgi:hypothetical protein
MQEEHSVLHSNAIIVSVLFCSDHPALWLPNVVGYSRRSFLFFFYVGDMCPLYPIQLDVPNCAFCLSCPAGAYFP